MSGGGGAERLEELVVQRPDGDPALPIFVGSETFVRRFAQRLTGNGRRGLVPHAIVDTTGRTSGSDTELFDRIANELGRTMPAGWGRLRLPSYWMLRDVLDVEVAGSRYEERRMVLRDRLYARHQELRPISRWLGQLADDPAPDRLTILLRPLTLYLPRFVFGWRLVHGRRQQWLPEELAHSDYLGAALRLVRGGAEAGNEALIRRLLLLGLLHDLDRATRGRGGQKRRRVTPFVVLLPEDGGGGARFLDELAQVEDPSGRGVVLVLTAAEVQRQGQSQGQGQGQSRREVVQLTEAETEAAHGDKVRPAGPRERNRAAVVAAIGGGAALVALIALLVAARGGEEDRGEGPQEVAVRQRCPGMRRVEAPLELIGVSDGTSACSFFPEIPGGTAQEQELNEKHQAVERTIAEANKQVVANAAVDPYRTIVFFAPLTVPGGPERIGQTGLRQLRGIALAQEANNLRARGNRSVVPLRVVLANPGDRFAEGVEVAEQIVAVATSDADNSDDTIVGVVGIAQSRAVSREAVGILGEAGLPVVAGPVTGDAMVDEALSDSYYQVSPRNERIAALLADFAIDAPIVGHPRLDESELQPVDDAVMILDPGDEYSRNLADDFEAAFVDEAAGHGVTSLEYRVDSDEDRLGEVAADTCAALDDPTRDIVFYASRSQQLIGLLDSMADECPGGVTMVAGSDLTKFVQDPLADLAPYDFLRLYYASFSLASADVTADERVSREQHSFLDSYTERYTSNSRTFDIGDAALTYDAFRAVQEAIDHVPAGGTDPTEMTGPDVAEALASGSVDFEGASGYITFDRADGSVGRFPPDKVVLVVEVDGRKREVEVRCGQITEATLVSTWGPTDIPCPRDD